MYFIVSLVQAKKTRSIYALLLCAETGERVKKKEQKKNEKEFKRTKRYNISGINNNNFILL